MSVVNLTEGSDLEGEIDLSDIELPSHRLRRLRDDVVDGLARSMSQVGLIQAITVCEDGRLIAGWHRFMAAKQLGWSTIRAVIIGDRSADLMSIMEIDENLIRADLSPAERAAHQAERKKLYEREYPQTRHGAVGGGHPRQSRQDGNSDVPRYTADAARKTGASERTVYREVARGEIQNVIALAGSSLDTPDELDALVKLPKPEQGALIERAKSGEKVSAKTELKKLTRDERERGLAGNTAVVSQQLGKKLYGVICADPPWRFEPWSRDSGMDRAADNHYPTMTLENIKQLPIPAADDCVLFLWATVPMLTEALDVMRAWGFAYKSHCVWLKSRQGTGYWFRNMHELLLVGTRGNIPAPAPGQQSPSVITAPTRRHSVKPAEFDAMIEQLFPTAVKLQMFARRTRQGWDSWGNEL